MGSTTWRAGVMRRMPGGESADALDRAGFETAGLEWQARTNTEGAGSVRLVLSTEAARDVAALVRAVARLGKAG
ncbi:hypothetical protein [Streptomyces sp. NPDC001820]|uniref:hypothetical protein n=1 Tax=Streptomyces sp. NPDC001820 TaxID=3364613 RepID=UPI003684D699